MKLPLISVKSTAPAFLIARHLRSVRGITSVIVYGRDQDWCMDVTYRGETYSVDKQLGEVQVFAPERSAASVNQSDFAAVVSNLPKSFGSALLKACFG